MGHSFAVITFDCYGTLIDWRRGIAEAFEAEAERLGVPVDTKRVLDLHAEVEPAIQHRNPTRPYAEILRRVAVAIGTELEWPIDASFGAFLPQSLPAWPPFADTAAALERLRSDGLVLGILSNVDRDLFAATARHFPVEMDFVITAEDVGSYKPEPAHFLRAREEIADRSWLHAAQSYYHDIEPACVLGIPAAWVNRLSEPDPGSAQPTLVVPDLAGLVESL